MKPFSATVRAVVLALGLLSPLRGFAQTTAEDYLQQGIAKDADRDWDGAIADYTRALELTPKDSSVLYYWRGIAKSRKADPDGAIADFTRALELELDHLNDADKYNKRGDAKNAKGDLDGAIADYTRALKPGLNDKDAYYSYYWRGILKANKGDLDGAIADFTHALERHPNDLDAADVCRIRGEKEYLLRRWTAALQDYTRFCKLSEHDQDYPRLFIWLIRARQGETAAAGKELAAFLDQRGSAAPGDWISNVAGHLLGKVSEADLFAAAKSPDAQKESGQLCEAWFYAGMKKLLGGDKAAAADYFRKCVATGQKDFDEYEFAGAELKALARKPGA